MFVKLLFSFCLTAALYGTVLGVVVYLLNLLLKKQIPARFRFLLWLIAALRLLMPIAPEARFSLFNLLPAPIAEGVSAQTAPAAGMDIFYIAALIWLCGAAAMLLRAFIPQFLLCRELAKLQRYDDPVFEETLKECREKLGIRREIVPVIQNRIDTPAVFGFFRPRLLLQKDVKSMPRDEVRHIILHECCHVKRHDVLSGCLLSVARAVHWFNPLVWLFDFKARQEMEIAADEKAVGYMKNDERIDYGMTIINTAAKFSLYGPSAAVGMSGEKRNIKRRIKSVAAFKKPAMIFRILGAALVMAAGCTCLTNAKLPEPIRPESNELYRSIVSHRFSPDSQQADQSADASDAERTDNFRPESSDRSAESGTNAAQTNAAASSERTVSGGEPNPSTQPPTTVIINDAGIYSSASQNGTAENAAENGTVFFTDVDGGTLTAKANRLKPGTGYDDVKFAAEAGGGQPYETGIGAGETKTVEKEPTDGEISVYLNSESSDMVSIDVYDSNQPAGRLLLKPRTFASYTVSGLKGLCRLVINASAPTIALIY